MQGPVTHPSVVLGQNIWERGVSAPGSFLAMLHCRITQDGQSREHRGLLPPAWDCSCSLSPTVTLLTEEFLPKFTPPHTCMVDCSEDPSSLQDTNLGMALWGTGDSAPCLSPSWVLAPLSFLGPLRGSWVMQ